MQCIALAIAMSITSLIGQSTVDIKRITDRITLDGKLTEPVWKDAQGYDDFWLFEPTFGERPQQKPRAHFLYDDDAVYVGVSIPVSDPSHIKKQLLARDNVGNSDWFMFIIDTYGTNQIASEFLVSSAGVQFDAKMTEGQGEDTAWDEVWYSDVHTTDSGWSLEMKIPYSALRFPKIDVQKWRLNCIHYSAHHGEKSCLTKLDPNISSLLIQSRDALGVKDIKAPLRLSLTPYVSSYVNTYKNPKNSDPTSYSYSYSGGMDIKYGINDAFTLDMTLIPDFGQVRADDRVLNLSPFEVQFTENRPFFTEGTELFNKAGLFYSRRVGGRPTGFYGVRNKMNDNETLASNPNMTQLYNATKVSGRTNSRLGLGFFNATAAQTHATVKGINDEERKIETAPLTNYNIVVADQQFGQASSIALINTNVTRFDNDYNNANVTGIDFDIKTKGQKYRISGDASLSNIIRKGIANTLGYKYQLNAGKNFGKLGYGANISGISRDYNINDLGYVGQTNYQTYSLSSNYSFNEGLGAFNRLNFWLGWNQERTFDTSTRSYDNLNYGFWGRTKTLWTYNMWSNITSETKDFNEARKMGRYVVKPAAYNMGWYIGTDSRKPLYASISFYGRKRWKHDMYNYELAIRPRYRINDHVSISASLSYSMNHNSINWVDNLEDQIIMGYRDRSTYSNVFTINYAINNKMSISGRARHYYTKVSHNDYFALEDNGELGKTSYEGVKPYTYNDLNIDVKYTWRFAAGSDIILGYQSNIQGLEKYPHTLDTQGYVRGVKNLSSLERGSTFSLRILYYLNSQKLL